MSVDAMPLFSHAAPAPAAAAQPRSWDHHPTAAAHDPVADAAALLGPEVARAARAAQVDAFTDVLARLTPTVAAPGAPDGAPRAPVREAGYALGGTTGVDTWWQQVAAEPTPELQWPASIATYDRMRDTDPQVSSVLRAITLPVQRTRWYLDPNGADPDICQHVAADLGLPLAGTDSPELDAVRRRDRFSWGQHLADALEHLVFGHAVFEQVAPISDRDGLAHLQKLAYRPPGSIAAFKVAPDGGLVSITQRPQPGQKGDVDPLPVSRLVVYVNDRHGGNWRGKSLLRPVFKNWILKDRLLRVGTETIERNGMGVPLYTGGPGETNLTEGKALAQAWRSAAYGGGAIPNGATMRLVAPDSTLPDGLEWVRYHDTSIAGAVLANFLSLGQSQSTGSYMLGATFLDFFVLALQTLAQQIADTATHHVVEDLVDWNYGTTARAPRIAFDEIGSRQVATAQAVALLVQQGIITADEALDRAMRTHLGLPAPGGATKAAPTAPATPLPSEGAA